MKKYLVFLLFLFSSVLADSTSEQASTSETAKEEEKVKFSLGANTEYYAPVNPVISARDSNASIYLISGSIAKENNKVTVVTVTNQIWNPGKDEKYFSSGDHYLFHKYTLPKVTKFQDYLNPSFESRVIFPTSPTSRANSKLYSLRETITLDGGYKRLAYTLGYKGQVNRFKYETTPVYAGGDYLSDYSNRMIFEIDLEVAKGLTLITYNELGLVHYYDEYEEGVFLFNQTLQYAFKDLTLYISHEIGDTSTKDRNTKSNIRGFDYEKSTMILGANYVLKF